MTGAETIFGDVSLNLHTNNSSDGHLKKSSGASSIGITVDKSEANGNDGLTAGMFMIDDK